MATRLDDELVQETLQALPGWQGDERQISREVHLPPPLDEELRRLVEEDAEAMDHHPEVHAVEGGTRFVLSTHSAGGVTELDVALAARISDLAHRIAPSEPGVEAVRPDDPDVPTSDEGGSSRRAQDAARTSLASRR